jgi:uncharacterized protein YggL (DUF469 family)
MSAACPVFGFVVHLRVAAAGDAGHVAHDLRRDVLDRLGLLGRIADRNREITISGESGQATDADREAVLAWLAERADVESFEASPLIDIGTAA